MSAGVQHELMPLRPELLTELAEVFGAQCVVLAIDARREQDGSYGVYVNGGRTPVGRDAIEWAREGVERGAGEILLTSMDRDGTKDGYDIELTRAVADTGSRDNARSAAAIASSHRPRPRWAAVSMTQGSESSGSHRIASFADASASSKRSSDRSACARATCPKESSGASEIVVDADSRASSGRSRSKRT